MRFSFPGVFAIIIVAHAEHKESSMIILACDDISKSYGIDLILDKITFSVAEGARMGVVGPNGSGKTTLFRIITGSISPDSGSVYKAKGATIGHLEQNSSVESDLVVWDELLKVYEPVLEMEKRIRSLELEISRHEDTSTLEYKRLADEYAGLLEEFEAKNGYSYESLMRGVLTGLGFSQDEYRKPVSHLSGGQKARVAMARLLLQKPEILLLDEPTNYLDLDSVQWLEDFLKGYDGTVIIISHDRYFLDRVCDSILEIENHKGQVFAGNYTEYHRKKRLQVELQEKEYRQQQKEIERQEAIIRRYRSYNREKSIRAAESREKALARMTLVEKPVYTEDIRMTFKAKNHCGRDVLSVEGLSMAFGNNCLFENVSFRMEKGDRVGIIGANGTGKTTLFRLLLGKLKPLHGEIRFGTGVDIGYYDQEQTSLDPANTLIDELSSAFPHLTTGEIRNALALFLFRGDDVFKPIGSLSGGERGRVILAKLMLAQNNFLLLDEPTNHLDMASKEVLENALSGYDGSILVISHDRYFLNKIADRILVLENMSVTEYQGNYDDYIAKKAYLEELKRLEAEKVPALTRTALKEQRKKEQLDRQKKKAFKQLLSDLEEAIKTLEQEVKKLEAEMCSPDLYNDIDRMLEIQQLYNKTKTDLDAKYNEWLMLQEDQE